MTQASGWGLTARLVSKHFGALGGRIAEAIQNWDLETATEVDRERHQRELQEAALNLAKARAAYEKERKDVVDLKAVVANDEKSADVIAERLAAGTISEAVVNVILDELEANRLRLPQELEEEASAKEAMDALEEMVKIFSDQLSQFDAKMKKSLQARAVAESQIQLQRTHQQNQERITGLRSKIGGGSTVLDAIDKRTRQMTDQAAGMKIITDLAQKPIDQANAVAELRRSIAAGNAPQETTLERLKRVSAAKAGVPAA